MLPLIALGALSVAQGMMASSKAREQQREVNRVNKLNEAADWADNAADNKAIAEANLQNTIRTGYKVGLLNVQRAQSKKRAMQAGLGLAQQGQEIMSAATANAAAAGTVGSSVDAVLADIDTKIGDAQAQLDTNFEQESDNFDVQLGDILNAGQAAQQSTARLTIRRQAQVKTAGMAEIAAGALIQVGGAYLSSKMSLGLGNQPTTTPTTTGA